MRFPQIWLNTSHKFQKFLLTKGDTLLLPYLGAPLSVFWGNTTDASSLLANVMYAQEMHHFIRHYIYLNFTLSITEGKLSEAPYNKTLDWNNWYIFWSVERAVAKNHVQSNYKLTKEGFLSKVCELKKPFFCFCFHIVV
jgi:hypothetical protein